MLTIRLIRKGKKNQPFFRIVVTDRKNPPRGGRFLEIVGFYNPLTKEKSLKKERLEYWLKVGAKPSDRVHNMLVKEGIIKAKKIAVHAKAKKKKEETAEPQPKKEAGAKLVEAEAVKERASSAEEAPSEKPTEKKSQGKAEPTPQAEPAQKENKKAKEAAGKKSQETAPQEQEDNSEKKA